MHFIRQEHGLAPQDYACSAELDAGFEFAHIQLAAAQYKVEQVRQTTPAGAVRYWRCVTRALRALPNLHTLTLAVDLNLRFAWVLAGCSFHLRHFCGYMAWDACLARFLSVKSTIADLELLADSSLVPRFHEVPAPTAAYCPACACCPFASSISTSLRHSSLRGPSHTS